MKSAGIYLLNYYSFRPTQPYVFLQIDWANFAVRGPSSFNLQASHEACGPTFQTLSIKLS